MVTTESKAYAALFDAIDPIIQYYRDDLLKHDLRQIELAGDDVPFISAARDTGTDLWHLWPANHPIYPAAGERVAYLFGHADREQIARGTYAGIVHSTKSARVLHYWNGRRLILVPPEKAISLASAWLAGVLAAWDRE